MTSAPVVCGSVSRLKDIVRTANPSSILLITGGASYDSSGAEPAVRAAVDGVPVTHIRGVAPNPTLEDVDDAIAVYREASPGMVIAIGGGSVIDVAKIIRSVAPHAPTARNHALGSEPIQTSSVPLVAIPTTAGTGSEATHFAVVYVDGSKHSISDRSLIPEHVILDPELTYSMPPSVTATTGLDALCQGIESIWSVRSTDASRGPAERAVALAVEHLESAVAHPAPMSRTGMLEAAHLAGMAIDVTYTTGPHALSYALTSTFGIPHGNAVALTLGAFIEYNACVTESDCIDERGTDHVRSAVDTVVQLLGGRDPGSARERFNAIVVGCNAIASLSDIPAPAAGVRRTLVEGVNLERLANNPRRLTPQSLEELIDTMV